MVTLRPFRATDLPGLSAVCLATADAGRDARERFARPDLPGDVFAVPYAVREPERVVVLDDGGTVAGYVLGTADTPAFVDWYRQEWLPRTADRYAGSPPPDAPTLLDGAFLAMHHDPERMLAPGLEAYPAHLHVDVLPHLQGRGLGRALIAAFVDGLRADGVTGLHLTMDPTNAGARAFYDRLGFRRVRPEGSGPDDVWLVRSTDPL